MARIAWSSGQTQATASKLRNFVGQMQGARDQLLELKLILDAYASDAAIGTDLAAASADATTIHNLVTQAYGELCNSVTTQVNIGQSTACRQLMDSLG